MQVWEEFAADKGVKVLAFAPEAPFVAEVQGLVNGGGGVAGGVWGRILKPINRLLNLRLRIISLLSI